MAITVIDNKRQAGISSRPLLELPLVLLVTKKHQIRGAKQLWSRDKIEETLMTFPRGEAVQTHFQEGLDRLGVEWFPGIEVNSARLIECYVENGYGIGATVATPEFKAPGGIRAVALPNFPPVIVGATWIGKLSSIARQFLAELELEAAAVKRRTRGKASRPT
jgi:DNA-binding transcriptional LysR family regulator